MLTKEQRRVRRAEGRIRYAEITARLGIVVNPREYFSQFLSEIDFGATVCQWLEDEAWLCQCEVSTSLVRVDVLARKDQAIRLIEVKNAWDGHTCAEALGQLLFGAAAYPQAELMLAMPKRPKPDILRLLSLYHVTLLDGPWL